MEFYVCEFNIRVTLPKGLNTIEFSIATPVPMDKEVSVYNGVINIKTSYDAGMPEKVSRMLLKWLPPRCSVSVSARRLPYPSYCSCASDLRSLVSCAVQILLSHLILLTYESTKSSLNQ